MIEINAWMKKAIKFFLYDGIHPTANGREIVADNVWKVLEPVFAVSQRENYKPSVKTLVDYAYNSEAAFHRLRSGIDISKLRVQKN